MEPIAAAISQDGDAEEEDDRPEQKTGRRCWY
jgi:hypothetical protein